MFLCFIFPKDSSAKIATLSITTCQMVGAHEVLSSWFAKFPDFFVQVNTFLAPYCHFGKFIQQVKGFLLIFCYFNQHRLQDYATSSLSDRQMNAYFLALSAKENPDIDKNRLFRPLSHCGICFHRYSFNGQLRHHCRWSKGFDHC